MRERRRVRVLAQAFVGGIVLDAARHNHLLVKALPLLCLSRQNRENRCKRCHVFLSFPWIRFQSRHFLPRSSPPYGELQSVTSTWDRDLNHPRQYPIPASECLPCSSHTLRTPLFT